MAHDEGKTTVRRGKKKGKSICNEKGAKIKNNQEEGGSVFESNKIQV